MADRRSQNKVAVSLIVFLGLFLVPVQAAAGQERPDFNMLVVGDSHIAGQGLKPENKFYNLVKEWLERDAFGAPRKVNLKVKAHGGSRLTLHADELAKMQKAGDDITKYHYDEANISQPSIRMQIDDARREYASGDTVDLVMLSGCITDVLVGNIVNPFVSKGRLRKDIMRYCGGDMQGILEHLTATFPRAEIVVVGYFPIASKKTQLKKLPPYFLRIVSFPRQLQCLFTNVVSRQLIRPLRGKIAGKSDVWLQESERAISGAVARVNSRLDRPRIHFVPSAIMPDQSYGTKQTLLWEVKKNQLPDDETYEERVAGCAKVFAELKYKHYGRFSKRMCELSSVAHPNIGGSIAFAAAIIGVLDPVY